MQRESQQEMQWESQQEMEWDLVRLEGIESVSQRELLLEQDLA